MKFSTKRLKIIINTHYGVYCTDTNKINVMIFLTVGTDCDSTFQDGLTSNGAGPHQCVNRPLKPKQYRNGSLNRKPDFYKAENDGVQSELRCILKEIRVITDKIRAEVFPISNLYDYLL